jgi:hypothetical protein
LIQQESCGGSAKVIPSSASRGRAANAFIASRCSGDGHGSSAEYVKVRDYAALGEPLAEAPEGILDACPIEQWRGFTHAASIS